MNKVFLLGRIVKDPELAYTKGDSPLALCKFSIAVNGNRKGVAPEYFKINAWGNTAETIKRFFGKGSEILVTGRLHNNTYKDREGNERRETVITLDTFDFTGGSKKRQEAVDAEQADNLGFEAFTPLEDNGQEELPFV